MKRKVLSALALSMVVGLAACQTNPPQQQTTQRATPTPAASAGTGTQTQTGPWELLAPLNKPAGLLTPPRSSYVKYPIEGASGVTIRYWLPLATNVSRTSDNIGTTAFGEYFQEEIGVNVEFIHPAIGNEQEAFGLLTASQTLPDIIEWEWTNSYTGGVAAAIIDGVATDLGRYIQPYGEAADLWQYLQDNPSVDRQVKTDDGVYYAFPFIRGSKYLQTTSGPIVRKDLLDRANLPVPVTINDWTEALRAFKDMGVGKPISAIRSGGSMSQVFQFVTPAFRTRADNFYINTTTDTVQSTFISDGMKETLRLLAEWFAEGLLDNEFMNVDRTTLDANILTGNTAVTFGAGGGMLGVYLASTSTPPGFDMVAAQYPVMNAGDPTIYGGTSFEYSTTSRANASITEDSRNPEIAAKVLNYAYSAQGHLTVNFGRQGISFQTDANGRHTYTQDVMRHPEWPISVAMAHFGRANTSGAFVQDEDYIFEFYELPQQKDALMIWGDNNSQRSFIPPITLTQEESNEFIRIFADAQTYYLSSVAEFVMGAKNIDRDWDAHVAALKGMNIDRATAIQQAAYERFKQRP